MKSKKVIKNIIIILIILIIIIIGILAYLYFMTDAFKTNKQLFFKYASQIAINQSSENQITLDAYFEKKNQMPYTNKGTLSSNTGIPALEESSTDQEIVKGIESANNMIIEFNGKIDNQNKKREENITLSYTNDVNFPFTYKQVGDIYAIKSDYFSTQNIAIENNNLKEFFEKLNIDSSQMPDKIEIPEVQIKEVFTQEEQEILRQNYLPIILNNLEETDFTVNEEENQTTYTLTLTQEKIKNILEQLLNVLKEDTIILNKINTILSTYSNSSNESTTGNSNEITSRDIEQMIEELQESEVEETDPITISLTVKEKVLSQISINIADTQINILYEQDQDNIKTTITLNVAMSSIYGYTSGDAQADSNMKIELVMSYSGLQEMQTVDENYNITISTEMVDEENSPVTLSYGYEFQNQVNFEENVSIENLNSNNSIILNDYSAEQIQNFLNALGQRIQDVNSSQMEEIQFEGYINPLIYTNPFTLNIVTFASNLEQSAIVANDAQIQAFNAQFEMYEGEIRGTMAKSLLQQVSANNAGDEDSQVELTGSITSAEQIDNVGNYEVKFGYDEEGRISEISIDLK